jgi:hypothetical protein
MSGPLEAAPVELAPFAMVMFKRRVNTDPIVLLKELY